MYKGGDFRVLGKRMENTELLLQIVIMNLWLDITLRLQMLVGTNFSEKARSLKFANLSAR